MTRCGFECVCFVTSLNCFYKKEKCANLILFCVPWLRSDCSVSFISARWICGRTSGSAHFSTKCNNSVKWLTCFQMCSSSKSFYCVLVCVCVWKKTANVFVWIAPHQKRAWSLGLSKLVLSIIYCFLVCFTPFFANALALCICFSLLEKNNTLFC